MMWCMCILWGRGVVVHVHLVGLWGCGWVAARRMELDHWDASAASRAVRVAATWVLNERK